MATSIVKFRFSPGIKLINIHSLLINGKLRISKLNLNNIRSSKRSFSSTQLQINQYGDPNSVVELKSVPLSKVAGNSQVLVKMMMAPINPSDINTIEGTYSIKPSLPTVLGNEGVGKIVDIGRDVRGLEVGDFVIPAGPAWGTWQNHKISNEEEVIKLPNDVPVTSLATISVNPCTAYRILKDYVDLNPGDVIIQNGANSGVGESVIQLCREWNIKSINIVRDRPEIDQLKEYLCSLGADYVFTEEYVRSPEMKKLLKSMPRKPQLALNCVGGKSATELVRLIDYGGVVVTYGGMSKKPVTIPTGTLIFNDIKLCGYWNTKWNEINCSNLKRFEMLADLCNLMRQSKFLPPKFDFYPLSEYSYAIKEATKGFKSRKVMFHMD